uniref:CTP synthase n=1 Tax=Parastrongyloides trichosuri TaxID=131310 RepID=A0A0N4ZCI3_PARTI
MSLSHNVKSIIITSSVVSDSINSVITASIGALLKAKGINVSVIQISMRSNEIKENADPNDNGEIFVLDDGTLTNFDAGTYERFLDIYLRSENIITTNKISCNIFKERNISNASELEGRVFSTVNDSVFNWIDRAASIPLDKNNKKPDVCLIELKGIIKDYDNSFFLTTILKLLNDAPKYASMHIHISYANESMEICDKELGPLINALKNLKKKNFFPNIVICRNCTMLNDAEKNKISEFISEGQKNIIQVRYWKNIYEIPEMLEKEGIDKIIDKKLKLFKRGFGPQISDVMTIDKWINFSEKYNFFSSEIDIGIVGKYSHIKDSYVSIKEALEHAAIQIKKNIKIHIIESQKLEEKIDEDDKTDAWDMLENVDGIVVPGGFGIEGVEGIILACQYARTNNIPFLGIGLGMQCAVIEFTKNVVGYTVANSTEFDETLESEYQIFSKVLEKCNRENTNNEKMRLGLRRTIFITNDSKLKTLYNSDVIEERHRNYYEINLNYAALLAHYGMEFVGMGIDEEGDMDDEQKRTESLNNLVDLVQKNYKDSLYSTILSFHFLKMRRAIRQNFRMDIMELNDHPYYVGCQFHPEFLTCPLKPSPPFMGLLLASAKH